VFVQGGYDDRRDAGLLYAVAAMAPGSDSARLERELIDQVERLAREPVGADELERARRQAEASLLLGWQSARGRAQALGTAERAGGDWRAAWGRLAALRALTPAELQRAAAVVLAADRRAVVWLRPAAGRGPAAGGSP
jgi:zinc protease